MTDTISLTASLGLCALIILNWLGSHRLTPATRRAESRVNGESEASGASRTDVAAKARCRSAWRGWSGIIALSIIMVAPPAMAEKSASWAIVMLACGNGAAANLPRQKNQLGDMPLFETEAKCKTALAIVSDA